MLHILKLASPIQLNFIYVEMSRNAYMKWDEIKKSNHPILDLKNNQKPTHMVFDFLWTGQGWRWLLGFHRPNGAKILRFGNFPHPPTCLGGVENCQKSKSFSKIWLWNCGTFAIISDRTRKPPHFQYIWAVMTMMGGTCGRKNGQTSIWYRSRQCVVSLVRLRSLLAS